MIEYAENMFSLGIEMIITSCVGSTWNQDAIHISMVLCKTSVYLFIAHTLEILLSCIKPMIYASGVIYLVYQ